MAFASRRRAFVGTNNGYRSGLEDTIQGDLRSQGVSFEYEGFRIPYIGNPHTYTPDFSLANGIVVETKGWFKPEDRTKHLLIHAQHPDIEIRFVFQKAKTKLTKSSKTTYGDWCDKHGFLWAEKTIPAAWLCEGDHVASLTAIAKLRGT